MAYVAPGRALNERRFAPATPLLVPRRVVISGRQRARTHPRVAGLLAERRTVPVLGVAALARHVGVDVLHHAHLLHDCLAGGLVAEDVHLQIVGGPREGDVREIGLLH